MGGRSVRSFDGITWQDENDSVSSFLSDVVYLDGSFIAAGGNGTRVRSIDGGVTWQDLGPYFSGHFRAIAAGNGIAVAVGHTYGDTNVGLVSTTTDGVAWTPEQLGQAPYAVASIAFGNGLFVARDSAGSIRVSPDGEQWGTAAQSEAGTGSVLFADGVFVVSGPAAYWTSTMGKVWDSTPAQSPRRLAGWFSGNYVALGWPATISVSSDLETWQEVFAPGGSGLTQIAIGSPGP